MPAWQVGLHGVVGGLGAGQEGLGGIGGLGLYLSKLSEGLAGKGAGGTVSSIS